MSTMLRSIGGTTRALLFGSIAAATLVALTFTALPVGAHVDPIGCDSNGVGLSLTVLRADGTTTVASSGGTIQSGETVKYRATLSHLGGTNCNFEAGTLTITTPDGVPHIVASGAGIPLVTFGVPFVAPLQPYVASEADAAGDSDFDASAVYANGIAHLDADEQSTGANTNIETPFQDTALQVVKTAVPASEVEYEWTIDKSVSPATWNLFDGDSGVSEYTIDLDKSVGTQTYSVSGTITITNPSLFATAHVSGVADAITGAIVAPVVCPGGLPQDIAPLGNLVCTYTSALPDGTNRTNTATVTTTGDVNGGSDDAAIDFTGVQPTETNGTVNVDDTNNAGDAGPFSSSTSYTYIRQFVCAEGEYEGTNNVVPNTATVVETDDSDDASVTVNCYSLTVQKTADTTFDRTYEWQVTKVADETEITLAEGEAYDITYTVTASVTGSTDSNWAVSGSITVNNPAPIAATINSVADSISVFGAVTVVCPGDPGPYVIAPAGSLVCTYSSVLPDGTGRTNTATATQQNHDTDEDGIVTDAGTTPYSDDASVTFGTPTNVFDDEVEVTDNYPAPGTVLGVVTVASAPDSFVYDRQVIFEGETACGDHNVDNTATITTNDNDVVENADERVLVHVNCQIGCTLTQGYWKTHNDSFKGGAPTDDGWLNIGGLAENTLFYATGQTWFQIFWTAPKGNVYFNLAHQYMAAKLNSLNGASTTPAVDSAITSAENLFNTTTIAQAKALKGAAKNTWTTLAGTLGSFNEGLIGPGHCDEQIPN